MCNPGVFQAHRSRRGPQQANVQLIEQFDRQTPRGAPPGRPPTHSGVHEPLAVSRRDARRDFPETSLRARPRKRKLRVRLTMAGAGPAMAVRGPPGTLCAVGAPRNWRKLNVAPARASDQLSGTGGEHERDQGRRGADLRPRTTPRASPTRLRGIYPRDCTPPPALCTKISKIVRTDAPTGRQQAAQGLAVRR